MPRDDIVEFAEYGIVRIPMPNHELTALVMNEFLKVFNRLPTTTPRCFDFPVPEPHHRTFLKPRNPDFGLMFFPQDNEREKDSKDYKVVLHYRPELEELWRIYNSQLYRTCRKLLRHCRRLYFACTKRLKRFGKDFDKQVRGFNIADGIYSKRNVLRIIAYTKIRPQYKKERIIGKPHIDRSSLTLALAESHDGLEYLDRTVEPPTWRAISSKPNRPLIFTGRKFCKHTRGRFKALKHRARQTNKKRVNRKIIRWALVFFHQPDSVQKPL